MSTILVADDDQLLRAIIAERLERAGHDVLHAGDGMAALDIAMEERPDCLVLDVMMPLARGLEVVRQVRREDGWHPAIVMVSARTRVTDRLNALDAGADAYVEKPFEPDDLLAIVEEHIADAAPTRVVDVLGPVWATLALERLATSALRRRTPQVESAHLESLFADLVTGALGRNLPPGLAPTLAIRVLWEDALTTLLGDVTDPIVPIATDLTAPDAILAVEAAINDHVARRAERAASPTMHEFWRQTIAASVAGIPIPRPARDARLRRTFSAHLRAILLGSEAGEPLTAVDWDAVLAGALGSGGCADPRHWSHLLRSTLHDRPARETGHWSDTLRQVLGTPQPALDTEHWASVLTEIMAPAYAPSYDESRESGGVR